MGSSDRMTLILPAWVAVSQADDGTISWRLVGTADEAREAYRLGETVWEVRPEALTEGRGSR